MSPGSASAEPSVVSRIGLGPVIAVVRRPDLWSTALRTTFGLAPVGWWRRSPRLPIPDEEWMRFRTVTAYGGDGTLPIRSEDLVAYLEWRRSLPH